MNGSATFFASARWRNLRYLRAVVYHLARAHVECHLPRAVAHLFRAHSLCFELPEGVHLEQIAQQWLQRVGRDRLELAIEVQGGSLGSARRVVPNEEASERAVNPILADVLAQRVHGHGTFAIRLVGIERPQQWLAAAYGRVRIRLAHEAQKPPKL